MSIYPNGKLPISAEAQAYHIRRAQILAKTQAAHEAEQRKLLVRDITDATYGATYAAVEAAQRKNTTNGGGSFCVISQEDYAKELGVSKRTIQRWETRDTTPPCLYDETTQKIVTYSAELRQDPTKAHVFAMNYKTHKRVKRNMHGATQYKAGFTDEANYRIQHGIPKSTQGRKSDYEGEADAKGIAGLRKATWG